MECVVGPVDFEDAPEKGAIVPALLGLAPFSFLSLDWRSSSSGATPLVGSEIFITRPNFQMASLWFIRSFVLA